MCLSLADVLVSGEANERLECLEQQSANGNSCLKVANVVSVGCSR